MSNAQDWLDDAADVFSANTVWVQFVAKDKDGVVFFNSDLEIDGHQASILFHALAKYEGG